MKCEGRTYGRTGHAPTSHSACHDHKKNSMPLSMSMELYSAAFGRKAVPLKFPSVNVLLVINSGHNDSHLFFASSYVRDTATLIIILHFVFKSQNPRLFRQFRAFRRW